MKKKLSRWLLRLAQRLNPSATFENIPQAHPMGLSVQISKKDVRDFRKDHPDITSHREGLKLLIEEAKWGIAGAIGRGMMQNKVIGFDVRKTLYTADVSGVAYIYACEEETSKGE